MRVGDNRVKKATTQQLCWKFNLTTFDDGETGEDYALRLSDMAAQLTMLDEEVKDSEIVTKMLLSLPPERHGSAPHHASYAKTEYSSYA
jgi:hypothetical protein